MRDALIFTLFTAYSNMGEAVALCTVKASVTVTELHLLIT